RRRTVIRGGTALLLASALVAGFGAKSNSGTWRTYVQNSLRWRYSELTEIDTRNVARLAPRWMFQTGMAGGFQTTPLVFDGLMFIAGPANHSWAVDALTGRAVWHVKKSPPPKISFCCGPVNRG